MRTRRVFGAPPPVHRRPRNAARRWLVAALAFAAASLPPRPGETYRFFQRLGDWDEVTSAAGARVWDAADLPLRFRLLENGNLPAEEGFDADGWREINRASLAAWVEPPTTSVAARLDDETVPRDQASDADGLNTIGFSSYEGFVDGWFSGFARTIWEDGEPVGCDIEISPFLFDRLPVDDPGKPRRGVPDLLGIMIHEVGHCLGLAHTAMNPIWLARPGPPEWEPGALPDGVATFQPHPIMSYGSNLRSPELTLDDVRAISLAYPAPGFLAGRGALGGRVVFPGGDPVPMAYVQAVDYANGGAAFGPGAFTDRRGQFVIEGMPPGPVHLWVRPLIAGRAHGGLELAMEAGSLDLVDRQRWFTVRAGEVTLVPDIVVERGRGAER